MIRFSLNLPPKYRLDLKIVKAKTLEELPLFPPLGKILRSKKGNFISRFFRHVFEHSKIKKILGTNLAVLVFATSFVQAQITPTYSSITLNETIAPIIFSTEKSLQYPVKEIIITKGFKLFHPGIDFDGKTGDPT